MFNFLFCFTVTPPWHECPGLMWGPYPGQSECKTLRLTILRALPVIQLYRLMLEQEMVRVNALVGHECAQ